ncbi:hypothetical protein M2323_000348 [Rhodoblastus acidophilus]|uniref:ATP-binding protein n=1 Tax=Rhodoblastus acidophilus TaxID=1074 RepID=UPI00222477A9|nr:ATP-binding protein [Rhodoblastus acidophilus]MCW2282587.1 hypothetical protein [Rhodoblastus acidophilus]MCW2331448.1 hypothetical protein [Rhodoblastus acidophilus]
MDDRKRTWSQDYRALHWAINDAPDVTMHPDYDRHIAEFRNIFIEHPRLTYMHKAFNSLRREALINRGKEQFVVPVIGPSQSGKTTAIESYVELIKKKKDIPKGHMPVVRVNLSPRSSLKQFQSDILAPLVIDDTGYCDTSELTSGTEAEFRARVRRYAELRRTELIVIDEAQHVLRANNPHRAKQVADMVKLMSIEGATAFAVVGTEESWPIFHSNGDQTPYRCMEPLILSPLDFEDEKEAKMFKGYVALLDEKLTQHHLTSEYSDFAEGDMPAAFWEVTRGILERVSRVVRTAWQYSFALGSPRVERMHLAAAIDRWAFPLNLCRTNPFRDGAREIHVIKDEWVRNPSPERAWERACI